MSTPDDRVHTLREALVAAQVNEADASRYAALLVNDAGCDDIEFLKCK